MREEWRRRRRRGGSAYLAFDFDSTLSLTSRWSADMSTTPASSFLRAASPSCQAAGQILFRSHQEEEG